MKSRNKYYSLAALIITFFVLVLFLLLGLLLTIFFIQNLLMGISGFGFTQILFLIIGIYFVYRPVMYIKFLIENKLVSVLLLALFIGWGVMVAPFDWDTGNFPRDPVAVDAIPDIGENQQIVFTKWDGRSPQDIEDQIASVNKIFALQGAEELSEAQEKYLQGTQKPHAIVLAANRGNELRELTEDKPKVMLSVGGKSLLRRLTDEFKKQSINT